MVDVGCTFRHSERGVSEPIKHDVIVVVCVGMVSPKGKVHVVELNGRELS